MSSFESKPKSSKGGGGGGSTDLEKKLQPKLPPLQQQVKVPKTTTTTAAPAGSVPRQMSQMSLHSVKSIATRLGQRAGDGEGGTRTMNRVLGNIYTQPLADISANPFVNLWQTTQWERLRLVTVGPLMVFIRIVPILFCLLAGCLFAKVAVLLMALLTRWRINAEPFRQVARDTCFAILRAGLFFAGFYWIRVIDCRKDRRRFAPIIPVAPHTSFFDVLIILKLMRPTFVSKTENQQVPLLGNILHLCKGIYVDREDKNSRQKTIEEIRNRANNGETILIFPEGTTANRTSLLQFKMGAFIPKLPVQPIIARWDAGENMDSVAWAWEGPSPFSLVISLLTRVSTNLEITILPEYVPNAEEKANTRLFAENVSKLMCQDLGVLQSYYSYDDGSLMPVAKDIRLFRSPACMSLLKLCYNLLVKQTEKKPEKKGQSAKPQSQTPVKEKTAAAATTKPIEKAAAKGTTPAKAQLPNFNGTRVGGIFGIGEDVDHAQTTVELYQPRNFRPAGETQGTPLLGRDQFVKCRWDKPIKATASKAGPYSAGSGEFHHLPISGARRRLHRALSLSSPKEALESSKGRQIYEIFSHFIEHCLHHLETHFEYRAIESSEDLVRLLDLNQYLREYHADGSDGGASALARLSPLFNDLLKIVEHSVSDCPVTTAHLLVILHLCDVREHDLWARLQSAITIFDMMRTAAATTGSAANDEPVPPPATSTTVVDRKPVVTLQQLRTLLWYSLGLQDFNDQFLVDRQFDLQYLRTNLGRTFYRAVVENGFQLLE